MAYFQYQIYQADTDGVFSVPNDARLTSMAHFQYQTILMWFGGHELFNNQNKKRTTLTLCRMSSMQEVMAGTFPYALSPALKQL